MKIEKIEKINKVAGHSLPPPEVGLHSLEIRIALSDKVVVLAPPKYSKFVPLPRDLAKVGKRGVAPSFLRQKLFDVVINVYNYCVLSYSPQTPTQKVLPLVHVYS